MAALSEASRITLTYQGGPMSHDESQIFEQDSDFETYLLMRRWDEAAKISPDLITVPDIM
jgi:predicted HD phosphohydrolase